MSGHIGNVIRQIRNARGKSQAVVAGRAGITPAYLSLIETGQRPLDSRSLLVRIAEALEVSTTELAAEMVTPVGDLPHDAQLMDVKRALMAVTLKRPNGDVLPASTLGERVNDVLKAHQEARYSDIGHMLPGLIRDIHTTAMAGNRDEREVLRLITLLHLQGISSWLWSAGGSPDLIWSVTTMGREAAERLDEPLSLALSAFGVTHGLLASGAFELAADELAGANPGTDTREGIIVTGMLNLTTSLLAASTGNESDREPPLDEAAELATRLDDSIPEPWFAFNAANVDVWRMSVALESGDHSRAAAIADRINPDGLTSPFRQAEYWIKRGRATAVLPRQREKAVSYLRRGEKIAPARLHRNPLAREALSMLLARAKEDAIGRELRGMARRSGLPV